MSPRPLVITADQLLLDDLLRVAATAGADVEVAADAGAARRSWATAPAVIVGADLAPRCAESRLPRRPGVVLLGEDRQGTDSWQYAVQLGAEHVVFLPEAEAWLIELLADADLSSRSAGAVLAVVGGRGGAGATTLATALALSATRQHRRALLVDADPLGGGIDLVFGGERATGLRWSDLGAARGRVPGAALTQALPQLHDLSVLSWDRGELATVTAEAMEAVLRAASRSCDVVVVDAPRTIDDAARVALELADVVLLMVPAEVRAAAAASRVAAHLGLLCRDLRVVVRGPAPSGLAADDVATALGLPLAGELRAEPGLARALERGEPPARRGNSPLAVLCGRLLEELLPAARRPA